MWIKQEQRWMSPWVKKEHRGDGDWIIKDYSRYQGSLWGKLARHIVKREYWALLKMRHDRAFPQVLKPTHPYQLVMSFEKGHTFNATDAQAHPEVFEVLRQAVLRLHQQGITHQDLHAANILIQGDRIIILDLGGSIRWPKLLQKTALFRQMALRDLARIEKMKHRWLTPDQALPEWVQGPKWIQMIRLGWKHFYRGWKISSRKTV